jgi:hypothetical protein
VAMAMDKNARKNILMKKIGFIILSLIFNNCYGQNNINMDTKEKFDIEKLNKNTQNTSSFYEYRDSDLTTITYADHGSDYIIKEIPDFPNMVCTQKIFHKSTLYLKEKGKYLKEGIPIGIWSYYDDQGNLIREENTDKGYNLTWDKLKIMLEDENVPFDRIFRISRGVNSKNGSLTWLIEWHLPDRVHSEILIYDATKCELISKKIERI